MLGVWYVLNKRLGGQTYVGVIAAPPNATEKGKKTKKGAVMRPIFDRRLPWVNLFLFPLV